jgi:hypothetical protein
MHVFKQLKQYFQKTGSLTSPTHVIASYLWSIWMPATEGLAVVEWEPSRCAHAIAGKFRLTQALILNVDHHEELHPYHNAQNMDLQEIVLYGCSSANGCIRIMFLMLYMKTFFGMLECLCMRKSSTSAVITSGHGLVLLLVVHVDTSFALE